MRRGTIIFIAVNFLIVCALLNSVKTLLGLLFEDGAADAIHRSDIPAPGSTLIDIRPQLIPKIIHQTYINSTIPDRWKEPQRSCIEEHPDYEYKLWTDASSREFIKNEYPWFLETFDSYPFPIQRADAIRYFVLAYYGGIYIDLDDGCQRSLTPLLSYPAWVRRTVPTGISNDAMGSVPQHPFFLRVIESLQNYNRNWRVPYITVMYTTGPLFLSVMWKEYFDEKATGMDRVRLLLPDEYNKHSWSFFKVTKGNSWHGKDAQTIFWMGKHWMLIVVVCVSVAGIIYLGLWFAWGYMNGRGGNGIREGGRALSPRRNSPRRLLRPFFWRMTSGTKGQYELIDRMA